MPEITVIHIAALFIALLFGIVLGWLVRGGRSKSEKAAINAGWQEQLQAQRSEHERLLDQNKSLMEQNSQYQASNKDAKMRASELSDALKEAFERRDELQRQIKDIRGDLEVVVGERDQLQSDMQGQASRDDSVSAALREKDERIEKLTQELANWQDRVPPLIESFRARNAEAEQLEAELESARERIAATERLEAELESAQERIAGLESMLGSEQTRVEPIDQDALRDGMDASNDPHEEQTSADEAAVHDSMHNAATNLGIGGDDLQLIKGVGPAIEKTLNEMGIFRFDQIAAMSEYDIDRVARRLKGFHSRIYREDWMGQARALQDQKASGQQ